MDVNQYLKTNRPGQITSLSLREPSSKLYAETGLFSETIFGQIGSSNRLITFGYIDLHTLVLQPQVYKNLIKLGSLYESIISGQTYAIFDKTINDFTETESVIDGSGTGFTFFMSHFDQIEFKRNESLIRSDRISLIEKYKDIAFCNEFLILPAGLRDLDEEQGSLSTDDINKLYQTLLAYTFAIPEGTTSTLYDSVRYSIQKKIVEIYDYIENILTGKTGFIRGAWGRRKIALGTRNVISSATYNTLTPNDPQTLQPDETKLGIFQTMKMLEPIVVHNVRTKFFTPILGIDSTTVALTNADTCELEYVEISNEELNRFDSPEAISAWISKFINIDLRFQPITLKSTEGKKYNLCMIYDNGTEISLFRSLNEFTKSSNLTKIDKHKIRPLTWAEMFYMVTYAASIDKHCFNTRYPVIQDESCYPTKIHLVSTEPSRVVNLIRTIDDDLPLLQYPEYPVLGQSFVDSATIGSARLQGLGADFDGDMMSFNAVLSDEANKEVHDFLNSPRSVINSQMDLLIGARDDLIGYTVFVMTSD